MTTLLTKADVPEILLGPEKSNFAPRALATIDALAAAEQRAASLEAERDGLREAQAKWLLSPEAAKRLDGYRELAAKCAALESENASLRATVETRDRQVAELTQDLADAHELAECRDQQREEAAYARGMAANADVLAERDALKVRVDALEQERDELRRISHKLADDRAEALDAKGWAEQERDCYKAARLTWPQHVLDAVARGDVEACRADAKARHDNWTKLYAERDAWRSRAERAEAARDAEVKAGLAVVAELNEARAQVAALHAALSDLLAPLGPSGYVLPVGARATDRARAALANTAEAARQHDAALTKRARREALEELRGGLCLSDECRAHCGLSAWRGCAAVKKHLETP